MNEKGHLKSQQPTQSLCGQYRYKHQEVRDLAWSLCSPALFSEFPLPHVYLLPQVYTSEALAQLVDWLSKLDQDPSPLLSHLAKLRSPRLGIYFEGLFSFFWRHYPDHELLHQNFQVNEEKQTFGELDFVVRHKQQIYHIETAVKFYLGVKLDSDNGYSNNNGSYSNWDHWIGPNCNDRLDKKLNRLLAHQLPLTESAKTRRALEPTGINCADIKIGLQLQGYLFYPTRYSQTPPRQSAVNHLRGDWYYLDDFLDTVESLNTSTWHQLQKKNWLSPAMVSERGLRESSSHLLSTQKLKNELIRYFENQSNGPLPRPILLTGMAQNNKFGEMQEPGQNLRTWYETQRCFIVPNQWPWTTTPSRKTKS